MDSDDEEMRDASSSGGGGDDGFELAEGAEGMVLMEVRWFEVDLDYEFDAPKWFDLARDEAPMEAAAAQQWFASAPNYPPSPLIAMMLAGDLGLQKCPGGSEQNLHPPRVPNKGRTPCYGVSQNERKPGTQTINKGHFFKGSTLMKPTASQLARQNKQHEVKKAIQSKMSVGVKSERSTMSSIDCTQQASKRQKLERGHLNKDVATNQIDLIHKTHEKNVTNGCSDRATGLPKLKITIPREPELATKLRAERSRILTMPNNSKQLNKRDALSSAAMKAAPTRKVTRPFQVAYHQDTSVRSNMPVCTPNHSRHLHNVEKKPEDCSDGVFKFKAPPLDKKVLASKGDMGVFPSAKRNPTVPKEFNLSSSRKGKQPPLSELFNKLTLTAETRRGIDRQASELPNYITNKDCKENMIGDVRC